jgi:hypothetical protein
MTRDSCRESPHRLHRPGAEGPWHSRLVPRGVVVAYEDMEAPPSKALKLTRLGFAWCLAALSRWWTDLSGA